MSRRILCGLGILALMLFAIGNTSAIAQDYDFHDLVLPVVDDAQMASYQAFAETFYTEGVDEEALIGFQDIEFDAIQTGMFAPDFTLLDLDGNEWSLSQFRGKAVVMLLTGSWY